jgi:UMF1 family MFS transporter
LLVALAFMGACAATLFLFLPSTSPIWPAAALLTIIANVGFGASVVAMNAYLPLLARESEEAIVAYRMLQTAGGGSATLGAPITRTYNDEQAAPLLASEADESQEAPHQSGDNDLRLAYTTAVSTATARISSQGIAIGYSAGIAVLALSLIPVTMLHGSTFALRLAIGVSGIWWAVGTVPAAAWLPSEASPAGGELSSAELESRDEHTEYRPAPQSILQEVLRAWKRLAATLHPKEIMRLRNTFKYLAAWFLLSDGSVSSLLLFASADLHKQDSLPSPPPPSSSERPHWACSRLP